LEKVIPGNDNYTQRLCGQSTPKLFLLYDAPFPYIPR